MKHILIFCLLFLLYAGKEVQAASCTNAVMLAQTTVIPADSLIQSNRVKAKNTTATLSLLFGVLGVSGISIGFTFFIGVLFAMGVVFSLLALILGIVGLKKRKKSLRTIYRNQPDAQILPLGRVQSIVGIVLGSIGLGFILFLIGFALAWSGGF